jgi:hypothetical protein
VCACLGASTFQVLACYESVHARHDSTCAYFFSRPRPLRYRSCLFIFCPRPFIFRSCPFVFRPRPFTFCPRLFRIFRARVVYVRACCTNVRARRIYINVRENIVRARGFAFAPDEVSSVHSSISFAPALMRLRPRVRVRQLPHAPKGP